MARMLQALKNLEARSNKSAAQDWLAHLTDRPQAAAQRAVAGAVPAIAEVESRIAGNVEQPAELLARPVRRAEAKAERDEAGAQGEDGNTSLALGVSMAGQRPTPRDEAGQRPTPQEHGRQECLPHAGRKPGALERHVRRTLNDSARSQPLVQLADRLQREAEQSTNKTLLLVGVGTHSSAHEVLVHVAALLAERHGERVLLIDADFERRSLSEGLEQGQASGLAEGLRSNKPVRDRCQATALAGVSLLPAGRGQPSEIAAEAARLEEILREAIAQHSFVLVDGGRSINKSARLLGRLTDAAYFVVQLGDVETREAQQALADFRATGARVLGCIAT